MPNKTRLSDDEVREIRRLRADNYPIAEIARRYNRCDDVIHKILRGDTYRDVTAVSHNPKTCACASCVADRRREENVRRGELLGAIALCISCDRDFPTKATTLLARPGHVICPKCRQEKKP